ncbi:hypothetical protein B0J11DRAFT_520893 [Dendryphion nanum]|uniref:Uncharacterized protein n=1 Tax=Dendryphion nanum TaxID=256645 RepID=A0A9P9E7D2_9PLEO|nr:hypothetical protein B0J11DRAFT_520893 [Dendryphion nanum]
MLLCPYYDCDNLLHWGPVIGPMYPKEHHARRRHHRKPCCDWCKVWKDRVKDFVGAATSYSIFNLTGNFSFINYGYPMGINSLATLVTNSKLSIGGTSVVLLVIMALMSSPAPLKISLGVFGTTSRTTEMNLKSGDWRSV